MLSGHKTIGLGALLPEPVTSNFLTGVLTSVQPADSLTTACHDHLDNPCLPKHLLWLDVHLALRQTVSTLMYNCSDQHFWHLCTSPQLCKPRLLFVFLIFCNFAILSLYKKQYYIRSKHIIYRAADHAGRPDTPAQASVKLHAHCDRAWWIRKGESCLVFRLLRPCSH